MKHMKYGVIILFFVLLILPVIFMNTKENVASDIDNRMLAEEPLQAIAEGKDGTRAVEDYVTDRIGFRSQMIGIYTNAVNQIFGELIHPSYSYGQNGQVFMNTGDDLQYWDLMTDFAQLLSKMQTYCEERGVPFLFVFEPAKQTVLRDQLDPGWNYNNEWVSVFEALLDDYGIHYIDNTNLMIEKTQDGEVVFNKSYDPGHWTDLGAFYGVNAILEEMHKRNSTVVPNTISSFQLETYPTEYLNNSAIYLPDTVPGLVGGDQIIDIADEYRDELILDKDYHEFAYFINPDKADDGTPKTLAFQGSYMNDYGENFLKYALNEYIAVHNYKNVYQFDYYYNIFKPDYVIFEMAEYTMVQQYFPWPDIEEVFFPSPLSTYSDYAVSDGGELDPDYWSIEEGETLATISFNGDFIHGQEQYDSDIQDVYLLIDGEEFDMHREMTTNHFTVTVEKSKLKDANIELTIVQEGSQTQYGM